MKFDTQEFYLRSPDEMYEAMPGHEEALATSARIADLIEPNYESLGLGRRCFPVVSAARREDPRGVPTRALRGRPPRALWRTPARAGVRAARS